MWFIIGFVALILLALLLRMLDSQPHRTLEPDAIFMVRASGSDYRSNRNKIQSKLVDYLLCDKASLVPLVAIELDDSSHDSTRRQERDSFVDEACKSAGLKLLHFRGQQAFDSRALQETLRSAIEQARA